MKINYQKIFQKIKKFNLFYTIYTFSYDNNIENTSTIMNKLINIKGISFYDCSEFNKVIDYCINVFDIYMSVISNYDIVNINIKCSLKIFFF